VLRSLTSRLVLLCLLPPAAILAASGTAAADAGDVLTVEWNTQTNSGTLVSNAAAFVLYPAGSATAASGAVASVAGSAKKVTLAPPAGALFESGKTYTATPTATSTTAKLALTAAYSTSLCPRSTVTSTTATIHVHEAGYDSSAVLTQLAADYQATCTFSNGTKDTVSGSVRYKSAWPWIALQQAYQPDVVALGHERVRPVTITAVGAGKSATLGAASLTGVRAHDYRIVANGCEGSALAGGDSCQIDVAFEPLDDDPNGPWERRATLEIDTSNHVTDPVRVLLNSRMTKTPGQAATLTTYPTASGVGVTWEDGWPTADGYRLERRLGAETEWTTLSDLPHSGPYNYVDSDPAPGQGVQYRVTGYSADWDGPSSTTATTRPDSVPTPGPNSLMGFGSVDAATGHVTVVDGTDGGSLVAWGGQGPAIQATAGSTGDGIAPAQATYRVPFVPGPGEYRSADGLAGWLDGTTAPNLNCTYVDAVLDVRSVLYDEARKPLVFDGSYAGRCTNGTVSRVEIRLGVDTAYNHLTTDPALSGRLTTFGGASKDASVTVTNHGPEAVTFGVATLRGDAPGDWAVTGNTCADATLDVNGTCAVQLRFSSTADNARPAVLEVAQQDATGPLAPVLVPLDGWGATPPAAPYGFVSTTIGALAVWSAEAPNNGGLPIETYEVQRRPHGATAWTTIATVGDGPTLSYVDQAVSDGATYDYRARAINAVGPGPWGILGIDRQTAKRAVVVSGSVGTTGTRGLFQLTAGGTSETPYIALTDDPQHDYRDPAASPAGTRLAVSVSTGDGSDGEYDLWAGTLAQPKSIQLTCMPGAERDARYSPDASRIAFTHIATDGSRSVWVIPALGGEPQKVREAAAAPAWIPDESALVVEDDAAPDAPLLRIDLSDGDAQSVPGTAGASDPAVSREGAIAFTYNEDWIGRVLELAPGSTTPTVKRYWFSRSASDVVYDDSGNVFVSLRWSDTGEPISDLTSLLRVSGEPAPVLQDREKPWFTPSGLTEFVRGTATFKPQYDDQETPHSALRPKCRLDGGTWTVCTGETTYSGLTEGAHVLTMSLTDEAGHVAKQAFRFVSDTVAPKLLLNGPSTKEVLAGNAPFTWNAIDEASGSAWYDIKIRVATPTTGFSGYRLPKGWTTAEQRNWVTQKVAEGEELCLRGRVRDQSGLWSPYVERCVARPLDDASLHASAGWQRSRGSSGLYLTTESVATRKGSSLVTGTVTVRRIGVLATVCPRCGAVKVYAAQKYLGTVSLKADRMRRQQLFLLPQLPEAVTIRVRLTTTSGHQVSVDGLMLRRT